MTQRRDERICIPYQPRPVQKIIHRALESHRFCVLVTHRQLGKTVCAVNHMLKSALINPRPNARYFYVAPLLKQAKLIAWDYFKRYARALPGVRIVEGELCLQLPNKACIWLCGADNPDALRGTYADGVVLDEYAQMRPHLFTEIIRPTLLSRQGWCVFMGTPKGQNAFFELFCQAQKKAKLHPAVWWCGVFRANETGVIPAEELKRLEEETPGTIFRQEYLCDFTASSENILISIDQVLAACARNYAPSELQGAPKIMGIDPARFGDDRSVIFCRQGCQALEPLVFTKIDNMTLAARAAQEIDSFHPDGIFIDSGCGGGVIDRLRQLGYTVTEVAFGGCAARPGQYVNKRAEMWSQMGEWIRTIGALPNMTALKNELCTVQYDFDIAGRLRLEPKEKIKERTGKSPDLADALALTFAAPVRPRHRYQGAEFARSEYEVL